MSTASEKQLHRLSSFLDDKQNSALLKLLGTDCFILSTAVLKLFSITIPPENVLWKRRSKCVACLVTRESKSKNSTELIVLSLDKKKIYWEKELPSEDLEYKIIKPLFHLILDTDDGMVGLNFRSQEEANSLAELIHDKLSSCENSTSDSGSHKLQMDAHEPVQTNGLLQPSVSCVNVLINHFDSTSDSSTTTSASAQSKFNNIFKHLKPSKNTKKLAKDKISTAFDFAHIHHIGHDPGQNNFTYDYMDSSAKYRNWSKKDIFSGKNLEKLLEAAGVTQSDLIEEHIEEGKSRDSDDSKSIDTNSSTEDNLETTNNSEEAKKSSLKISTVSENLEFSKIMSELKLYQRESYYTKDFNVPLTPKIVDFTPEIEEEGEEDEEDQVKKGDDEKVDQMELENGKLRVAQLGSVKKDIFTQIGVDAMKAFQNRSMRMSKIPKDESVDDLPKERENQPSEVSTTTMRLSVPMPAPRRSKLYQSSENLQLDQMLDKIHESNEEIRENLI